MQYQKPPVSSKKPKNANQPRVDLLARGTEVVLRDTVV